MPSLLGRDPGLPVDLLALDDERADRIRDVLVEAHLARADLTEGGHRRLVGARNQPRGPGRDLAGVFGPQHHESKIIVDLPQAIFDRYARHQDLRYPWRLLPE